MLSYYDTCVHVGLLVQTSYTELGSGYALALVVMVLESLEDE